MKKNKKIHPAVYDFRSDFENGKLTRREFLRYATLLGVSAAAASQMAGLWIPGNASASPIRRGGTIRVSGTAAKITHPANISWISQSQLMRQVAEYLTFTDENNITHPYLLESWEASHYLKTWTLNIRSGIRFNNGDELTADDVIFSFRQWLDKDVGSSLRGMIGGYLSPNNIKKLSKYQIRLFLKRPELAVPEHLFHYPALILNHRTFEGDFLRHPHGTGPYTIESHKPGERYLLRRRKDYWQTGEDKKNLPYLDAVEYLDLGEDMSRRLDAILSGEVDVIDLCDVGGPDFYLALKDKPQVSAMPIPTAQARVLRMRVDRKPWDDNRVRMALKLCQDRKKILKHAYYDQGLLGHDTHVYPRHPEYCRKRIPRYDPDRARSLLKEAGYSGGIDVTLAVGQDWKDVVRYAEILKADAAPAGFRIKMDKMPNDEYYKKWTEFDLGITPWTHRPLGTMVMNLAYIADDQGKPVAWNETRWVDNEFSKKLELANGTLNNGARRRIFCELEDIQMKRGSIGIPFWRNVWMVAGKRVQDIRPHPNLYLMFDKVWLS